MRLSAVRSAIFALFSQIWIAYPHSPAVAHERIRRDGPRPGERAPFGRFEFTHERASVFDVFDVCGGAVDAYGKAERPLRSAALPTLAAKYHRAPDSPPAVPAAA